MSSQSLPNAEVSNHNEISSLSNCIADTHVTASTDISSHSQNHDHSPYHVNFTDHSCV